MVANPDQTSLVVEYFCFEDDEWWLKDDDELLQTTCKYLYGELGFENRGEVVDYVSVRVRKAYPIIDVSCRDKLAVIGGYLRRFSNLQVVGRSAMFFYDDMSHPLLTGLRAADNILGADHDLFAINRGQTYREDGRWDSGASGDDGGPGT